MSVQLLHGDALAVLRDLPDGRVDAVITDPPYSSGGFTRGDRASGSTSKYTRSGYSGGELADFAGDNRDQRGWSYWMALWLAEAHRATRPGGVALLFTDWRQLPYMTDALQAGGWVWRGIVPWAKSFGGRGCRPDAGRFAAQCEYVAWGSRGSMGMDFTNESLPGFFSGDSPRGDARQHSTEKPLAVMRELVRICPAGGTVLDPFAGSGTTGVAAVLEGRDFIGVELTEHYAAVALERITAAERGYHDDGHQLVLMPDGAVQE